MLNKLCCILAKKLTKYSEPEKEPIYVYGLELIISTIICLISILLVSVLLSDAKSGILFVSIFVPLRLFTGGYHAATYSKCFIISNFSYLVILFLKNIFWNRLPLSLWILILVCTGNYITRNAPVINVHQPIDKYKQLHNKKITKYILLIDCALIVYLLTNQKELMCMAILSICLIAAFMLIADKSFFIRKGRTSNEISC